MDFTAHHDNIVVRDTADNWGPFLFNMVNSIPDDDTVASVTSAKTYLDKVLPTDTLADATELTGDTALVDEDYALGVVSDTKVSIRFKAPTATTYKGRKATLVITVVASSGGTFPFFFHYIEYQ